MLSQLPVETNRMTLTRRSALTLALPALGAACGDRTPETPAPFGLGSGPPSYSHLTPIRLDVAGIDIAPTPVGVATLVVPPAPIEPAQAMQTMARDRLFAGGTSGRARFAILTATLTRQRQSDGGLFSSPTERLNVLMRCRVEILGGEGEPPQGFAQAETNRSSVMPAASMAERTASAERIVRQAMADLNIELEYQIRRNLRRWLVTGPAATRPAVDAEELPRT